MKVKSVLVFLLLAAMMVFVVSCGPEEGPDPDAKVEFPTKAITIYNTHAPGGAVDKSTQPLIPYLEKYSPVPIVYDTMEGAGGRVCRDYIYNADPDGYTLLSTLMPSMQLGEVLYDPKYKTEEMTHIFQIAGDDYFAVMVRDDSPYQTIEEMIEASKTKTLTASGSGTGTNSHMLSLAARSKAGLINDYVPHESGGAAVVSMLGGHVDMSLTQATMSEAYENVRLLAIAAPERLDGYPDVPTFAELGFDEVVVPQATMVLGPPGIPDDVVQALANIFEQAMADPEFKALPKDYIPAPLGPAEARKASIDMLNLILEMKDMLEAEMEK